MSSSELILGKHCDFADHCDEECLQILTPYINDIERTLRGKHGNVLHYRIPLVIRSICSAYYCPHLDNRLAFKDLFTRNKYPQYDHFLIQHHLEQKGHCQIYYKQCPSIQRIILLLSNFQSYLKSRNYSKDAVSPYVIYKYYRLPQMLLDVQHIKQTHPKSFIKFYIRNNVIEFKPFDDHDGCIDHKQHSHMMEEYEDDLFVDATQHNEEEEAMKEYLMSMHDEFIHHQDTKQQLKQSVMYIMDNNAERYVFALLGVLKSVSKKLFKNEAKYRVLDTTNIHVVQRLLGYDGVFEFLSVLGFEANTAGNKLICQHQASMEVIRNAINVIDECAAERRTQLNANRTTAANNTAGSFGGWEIDKLLVVVIAALIALLAVIITGFVSTSGLV
eukprot:CAMPEP_0197079748 /NCGR_PEP_ID=MMETSP1384-20130603/213782_1 /TAXON_ID=29189 /ORGANISM="Ammonia sp." /LENGTH=387 /DNA_ID=CAMNT_0042518627 /DNA_START=25 /DNA_END=1188 /DNA_ORIENTATION=+